MAKPRGNVIRSTDSKPDYKIFLEPQFEILAWCRDEHAQLPPEQVHFVIHWPTGWSDIPPMAIRFKSPDTLGFFIEELARYRREVWPNSEKLEIDG